MDSWPGYGLVDLTTLPRKVRAPATCCPFLTHLLLPLSKGQGQLNSSPLQSVRAQAPSPPLALGALLTHPPLPPSIPANLPLPLLLCFPSPSPVLPFPSSFKSFPSFSDLTTFLVPDVQKCFGKHSGVCGSRGRRPGPQEQLWHFASCIVWGWTS